MERSAAGLTPGPTLDTQQRDPAQLLSILEQLLGIDSGDLPGALTEAAEAIAGALGADKVDAFLLDEAKQTLVALGTSDTPMGRRQKALGLDWLPLANGGRAVAVFRSGEPFVTGHADEDPDELVGIREALQVRSSLIVPLVVGDALRGTLLASSGQRDFFGPQDVPFLEAVARWVALVTHRTELVARLKTQAAEQARRLGAQELVTVLAHDLRNLLTPLKGRLQVIARAQRTGRPVAPRDVEEVTAAVGRLDRLVTDLLDVRRLEHDLLALSPQAVDVAELVRGAVRPFASDEARIVVEVPETLPAVADPERLTQAIENLLHNAVKHSPEGADVEVTAGSQLRPEGERIVISVADEGPGIAPDVLPNLFAPYAASAGSLGLGLGLYITHRIVTLHGGTVEVDSAPGGGARFTIILPSGPGLPLPA